MSKILSLFNQIQPGFTSDVQTARQLFICRSPTQCARWINNNKCSESHYENSLINFLMVITFKVWNETTLYEQDSLTCPCRSQGSSAHLAELPGTCCISLLPHFHPFGLLYFGCLLYLFCLGFISLLVKLNKLTRGLPSSSNLEPCCDRINDEI